MRQSSVPEIAHAKMASTRSVGWEGHDRVVAPKALLNRARCDLAVSDGA